MHGLFVYMKLKKNKWNSDQVVKKGFQISNWNVKFIIMGPEKNFEYMHLFICMTV